MKSINNKRLWKFAGLAALDGLMFGFTNPRNIPSFGLMAGFLLLVVTLYYVVNQLLSLARLYGLAIRRRRRLAVLITAVTGALIGLQSMGELNSRDVLVSLPLAIIAYGYIAYVRRTAPAPAPALSNQLSNDY